MDTYLVGIKPELRKDFYKRLAHLVAEGGRSNFLIQSIAVASYWRENGINGQMLPLPEKVVGVKLLEF